ncbi:MAG: DUF262 domain-containing protein [Bacteroidales bacterium]
MQTYETFDSTKTSLYDLLRDIKEGKLQLPDFQRSWIWDDWRIKGILASVAKSFPIGAIMLQETGNPEVKFKTRPIEGANNEVEPEKLILDGQQRLTSLFQAIITNKVVLTRNEKGHQIKRWYYIDMEKALSDFYDLEESIVSIPEDKKIKRDFGREIELDLSESEYEYKNLMYPVHMVDEYHDWRAGFNKYWNYEPEKLKLWDEFETQVINNFNYYMLPVIIMKKENEKEAICQVFEKVNTGGVTLSVFELLTATFAADGYVLRDEWNKIKKQFSEYKILNNVQNDDFLQAISLLTSYQRRKEAADQRLEKGKLPPVTCKRKDILKLTLNEFEFWKDKAIEGFLKAAKFLHTQFLFDSKDLPYRTQLVPLAVAFVLLDDKSEIESVRNKIITWFWSGVLGELYGSAIETRFAYDVQDLVNWADGDASPKTVKDANFYPERLVSLRSRNSAAYKGVYALLLKNGVFDFRSGETINAHIYFDEAIDIHHVFPKAWCENNNYNWKMYDSIINKTPLSYKTNRKIGKKAPSVYLENIMKESNMGELRMKEILTSHKIPINEMMNDDFEGFYTKRAQHLLEIISNAMNKEVEGKENITFENLKNYV